MIQSKGVYYRDVYSFAHLSIIGIVNIMDIVKVYRKQPPTLLVNTTILHLSRLEIWGKQYLYPDDIESVLAGDLVTVSFYRKITQIPRTIVPITSSSAALNICRAPVTSRTQAPNNVELNSTTEH